MVTSDDESSELKGGGEGAPPLELVGEAPLPARLVGFFNHPLKHYAAVYGYAAEGDAKTIKRFVKKGKEAQPRPDLPPLDDPAQMPAWWRRNFPNREVPPGIRRAASAVHYVAAAVVPEIPPPVAPADSSSSPPPIAVVSPLSPPPASSSAPTSRNVLDFAGQVDELRKVASDHLAELKKLSAEEMPATIVDPVDQAKWGQAKAEKIASAQKTLTSSLEILRKSENNLVQWQQAHGELWNRAEVAVEVVRVISAIDSAVKRLVKTVRPQLVGKTEAEQERIWNDARRDCFRILKLSKFDGSSVLAA